ncbi:unnamed protein product [Tilletia controversa]|uniref:Arginine decarboxylase n=1 Tax=Tilletia laevis TaxID=157183 RepID=A0A9N8QRJ1_9BASI|nr:hypothetical protein CF336_g3262 [Tilletia laevis]KAE8198845.1 hypothetical protein CF328_g3425 [Tilletia controversa]KAE8198847.1 hypothetical protein CF328_g3427 [Tilletia controversa]CAD6908481.1 unnamed protein product [Tilletia controversa]CAD6932522.1 unnamed protein product [Tilletia laevis]
MTPSINVPKQFDSTFASSPSSWTAEDSAELYGVKSWGAPWFSVNGRGKLCGLQLPLSIHWTDILEYNAVRLFNIWDQARGEHSYRSKFRGVLPMKVNCLNGITPVLLAKQPRLGVECGTLAELLLAVGLLKAGSEPRMLVVNGFKSEKFIEATLRAAQLPVFNPTILVFDRVADVVIFSKVSRQTGLRAHKLGLRARLAAKGAGKHASSTGAGSKFGMSADELIHVLDTLRKAPALLESVCLLHFHIGSQVSSISALENAFREGAQLYCRLRELGAMGLDTIDVGGGLAIKYDNTDTTDCSADYDWILYAKTAVRVFAEVTDRNGQPHPDIVTESGRALIAQHAMVVFDVEDTVSMQHGAVPEKQRKLLSREDVEVFAPEVEELGAFAFSRDSDHDGTDADRETRINELHTQIQHRFTSGEVSLAKRGIADRLRLQALDQLRSSSSKASRLSHQAIVTMSLFQSLCDLWALHCIFPTIPLQWMDEQPDIRGILTDLTCDSLGAVTKFQALGMKHRGSEPSDFLPMHRLKQDPQTQKAQPYRIAMCFSGAYNALLNGRHNLFGATDSAGIRVVPSAGVTTTTKDSSTKGSAGQFVVEWTRPGDTVERMLQGIGSDPSVLADNAQGMKGTAGADSHMAWYREMLRGSTYPPSSAIGGWEPLLRSDA